MSKKRSAIIYRMFLSHSSKDMWLSRVIEQQLIAIDIEVWRDEMSLSGGDHIIPGILNGIQNSHEAVVLVSNDSIRSQWVSAEIGMAIALNKRITPLLNNINEDAMPVLKSVKSYELNNFEIWLREVGKRIAKSQKEKG